MVSVNRLRQLQKTTTNPDIEVWSPIPTDTTAKQLPHLRLEEHCERGQKDCRSQRIREFSSKLGPLVRSEATLTDLTDTAT